MVKVQDTHLQMVHLHLSLDLKGVQLLLHLFPSILTSTNQDIILEDLLLIPLRLLPSVGTKDIASPKKIVHLNGVASNSFPFFFFCFVSAVLSSICRFLISCIAGLFHSASTLLSYSCSGVFLVVLVSPGWFISFHFRYGLFLKGVCN